MIVSQHANVVVVPVSLRMDVFQQYWLIKNNIVKEDASGFFTPVAVQCTDDDFEILILQDRIQVVSKCGDLSEGLGLASRKMIDLLSAAGSAALPISGGGLNALIALSGGNAKPELIRAEFLNSELIDKEAEVASIGLNFAQKLGFGLVTTKLSFGVHAVTSEEAIIMDFNCHRELASLEELKILFADTGPFVQYCLGRVDLVNSRIAGEE